MSLYYSIVNKCCPVSPTPGNLPETRRPYCTPIQEASCRSEFGFRVGAVAGSWHGQEQARLIHFTGLWIADGNGRAVPIDTQHLAPTMLLQDQIVSRRW